MTNRLLPSEKPLVADPDAVQMLLAYFGYPVKVSSPIGARKVRFNVLAFDGEQFKDERLSPKQQEEARHQRALARIRHAHEMKMKLKEKLT